MSDCLTVRVRTSDVVCKVISHLDGLEMTSPRLPAWESLAKALLGASYYRILHAATDLVEFIRPINDAETPRAKVISVMENAVTFTTPGGYNVGIVYIVSDDTWFLGVSRDEIDQDAALSMLWELVNHRPTLIVNVNGVNLSAGAALACLCLTMNEEYDLAEMVHARSVKRSAKMAFVEAPVASPLPNVEA